MENQPRGVIRNRGRSRQINDFRNLRYKNITPTDIDGFIELENRAYVYFEVKHRNAKSPYGQKLAFERVAVDHGKAGKPCLIMLLEHDVDDVEKDVDVAACLVRKVFVNTDPNPKWRNTVNNMTALELFNFFIEFSKDASPQCGNIERGLLR